MQYRARLLRIIFATVILGCVAYALLWSAGVAATHVPLYVSGPALIAVLWLAVYNASR